MDELLGDDGIDSGNFLRPMISRSHSNNPISQVTGSGDAAVAGRSGLAFLTKETTELGTALPLKSSMLSALDQGHEVREAVTC